jgi:Kef-type K+ transport system membrane component KefB
MGLLYFSWIWTLVALLSFLQNGLDAFKVRSPKPLLSTVFGGKHRGYRLYFGNVNDVNLFAEGISNIDQFIQGALNQATSTPALTTLTDPITTNIPELNLISLDETAEGTLNPLGNDLLIFFCTTIGVVPLFKWLKASSVIGFLSAGLLMGPAGLKVFSDLKDMESIADFGVLFLLFEQGLELTVDRLKSLSKFAFGMGTLQVILCTAAFFVFPFIGGVQFLEIFMGSDAALVDIERVDEAMVIGAALSLSSSAFVLKILQEKGQMSTKFGAACLGILLLQDIAVVPLLVLLPIIESNSGPMPLSAQLTLLGATFVKAILGLGGILVIGGGIVRYLFSLVAKTGSSETFIALCLLVALGTGKVHLLLVTIVMILCVRWHLSLIDRWLLVVGCSTGALTDHLGLSSTLGAFTAGTLLAESNYRTQIESDIKPFRGLLLGLFFLTTGASVDPEVISQQWPTVLALLAGLVTFKAAIITTLGPFFGLSKADSIRTGLLLSGGGEFAFVVLTLADKLQVLPDVLAKLLVGVVVISMAITPYLGMLGDKIAGYFEREERKQAVDNAIESGTSGIEN